MSMQVADKIEGFKKKINFWKRKVKDRQFDTLPLLNDETLESIPHVDISEQIFLHLAQLLQKFDFYFPEDLRP